MPSVDPQVVGGEFKRKGGICHNLPSRTFALECIEKPATLASIEIPAKFERHTCIWPKMALAMHAKSKDKDKVAVLSCYLLVIGELLIVNIMGSG